jgi:hypothetical protein
MSRIVGELLIVLASMAPIADKALADDPKTINAFSAWQGRGQVFETGLSRTTFVGSFSGMVFVNTEEGPIDSGYMICPTVVDIDSNDGKETAKGRCTITAKDGARLYADMTCQGVRMVGCNGDFTFTGGTERFKGITGGGPVRIRSTVSDWAAGGGNIVEGAAAGIILWPALTYTLPPQ